MESDVEKESITKKDHYAGIEIHQYIWKKETC